MAIFVEKFEAVSKKWRLSATVNEKLETLF